MNLSKRFLRITSGRPIVPQVEGLRFIAIISVVLFHIHASVAHNGALPSPMSAVTGPLVELSRRGVELFFVISGFILCLPFADFYRFGTTPVSLAKYFGRRVTRLEPPYLLSLFIALTINVCLMHASLVQSLPHFLASVFYLHVPIFGRPSTISYVTWSLEVEVQFYILAPILTKVFKMSSNVLRGTALLVTTMILGVVSLPIAGAPLEFSVLYYGNFFIAGFVVCEYYQLYRHEPSAGSWEWDVIAISLWTLVWTLGAKTAHVLLPFIFISIFICGFHGYVFQRFLKTKFIMIIGGMCYSIYLIHYIPVAAVGRVVKPLHFGSSYALYLSTQVVLVLPVVLVVTAGFYLLVERPCMKKDWPIVLWRRLSGRQKLSSTIVI